MRTVLLIIILLFSLKISFTQEFKVSYFHGQDHVNSISIVGDNIWVGGYMGLTRINRINHTENECIIDPFINHQNYCFEVFTKSDNSGNLFVHDGFNVFKYNQGSLAILDTGSYITDFYIDENNTKWILRDKTLTRIDSNGKKIKYNSENSSLPDYYYTCIFAKNNEVYLGSVYGFVKFNGKTSKLFNRSNTILPYNRIHSIAVDNQDNIWLSCDTSGNAGRYYFHYERLVKISGSGGTVYNPFPPETDGSIGKIISIEDAVYLCTNIGLLKFNGSDWTKYDSKQNHLLSDIVKTVAFEGNNVWIGTDSGISLVSDDTTENIKIANTPFSDYVEGPIVEDLSGNIWIGIGAGDFGKLCKYDGAKWKTIIQGDENNPANIFSLAVDQNNVVWATSYSYQGKLFKIDKDSVSIYDQNNSPVPSFPEDVVVDKDNNKWITSDWEIVKFNDSQWTIYNDSDFADLKLPRSIAADKKGNIWIGIHQSGMVKYDGTNWIPYNDSFFGNEFSEVNKIIVDNEDNLWMNYSNGTTHPKICKFDGNSLIWYDQNINLPQIDQFVGLLAVEKNGDIWVGYNTDDFGHGIAKYDWKEWKYYNSDNSRFVSNQIGSFIIDHNNNKWISAGCYVARFNEDSVYYPANPSEKNKIYSVFPNPCDNSIFLRPINSHNNDVQINLLDSRGTLVYSCYYNSEGDINLDLTHYPAGLYLVQIIGKNFSETHKVIKQ